MTTPAIASLNASEMIQEYHNLKDKRKCQDPDYGMPDLVRTVDIRFVFFK